MAWGTLAGGSPVPPGTPNRGFYFVIKTARSSRHLPRQNFAGGGGTPSLHLIKSPVGRERKNESQTACPKVIFRPPFQRRQNPKTASLVAPRTERNLFFHRSAGGETKQSGGLFWRGEPSPGVPRCRRAHTEFAQIARFYLDSFSPVTTFIVGLRHAPACTEFA